MMDKYICINSFSIELVDGDGFNTEVEKIIDKGEVYQLDTDTDYGISDVHLECNGSWIEITLDHLAKDFKKIELPTQQQQLEMEQADLGKKDE